MNRHLRNAAWFLVGFLAIAAILLSTACATQPSPEVVYWNCIYTLGWVPCKHLEVVK